MSSCTDSVPLCYCTTGIFRQESVVGCVWMCECTDYQIIHKKMTQKQKKKQSERARFCCRNHLMFCQLVPLLHACDSHKFDGLL